MNPNTCIPFHVSGHMKPDTRIPTLTTYCTPRTCVSSPPFLGCAGRVMRGGLGQPGACLGASTRGDIRKPLCHKGMKKFVPIYQGLCTFIWKFLRWGRIVEFVRGTHGGSSDHPPLTLHPAVPATPVRDGAGTAPSQTSVRTASGHVIHPVCDRERTRSQQTGLPLSHHGTGGHERNMVL